MNTADRGGVPPEVIQRLTALGGQVYAVMGGDMHVFGDGAPQYVMEGWTRKPRTERAQAPGHTEEDLVSLRGWVAGPARLSVRWLQGAHEEDTVRLGALLADECLDAGWTLVTARRGASGEVPRPVRPDEGAPGVLLIIESADRWPGTQLPRPLSDGLLHHERVPARVLLLARTLDGWPSLRAALANVQAHTSWQPLPG